MRLFLASLGTGGIGGPLHGLLRRGGGVAVVRNAMDYISIEERRAYRRNVHDVIREFGELGVDAFDLDLRLFFDQPVEALEECLADCELLFAVGGNAFLLRRALRQSGLDRLLPELLAQDRIVYGGWSAGAVVAGASLRGIELMDDPMVTAGGYDPAICWDGLGLTPEVIVPHVRSNHVEAEAAERAINALRQSALPHLALRDGEALVVDGDRRDVVPSPIGWLAASVSTNPAASLP